MKSNPHLEPPTVALLLGVTIGLGFAVHEAFFLVALGIATVTAAEALHEHWNLTQRHS